MPKRIAKPDRLAALVRRVIKKKGLNPLQVAKRAARAGHKITDEYVRMILTGEANNLTIEKLEALASGIDEPLESVLFAAAGITPDTAESFKESTLYRLYLKSVDTSVSLHDRVLITELAEMLVEHLGSKAAKKK